jgi:hypothetical protein
MSMEKLFLGFPPLPKALQRISELEDAQYKALLAEIGGGKGFSVAEPRVTAVAGLLGSDESEILDLLQSLDFLYDRCREWETDDEDFGPPLRSFLRGTRLWGALGSNADASFDRLMKLLQPNPFLEQSRKLRWLRTGILDTAVEFASFVDLRPDFSKDRSEVRGLVPVVLLRVRTESDLERDRSHAFQLTIDGVRKLRKVLDDIDRKLDAIGRSSEIERLVRKDGNEVEGGTSA